MSGDSEEKVLPPTERKLKKAREKGQIASSQDFVSACVTTAALLYLVFTWQDFVTAFNQILEFNISMMQVREGYPQLNALYATFMKIGYTILPLAIIIPLVGIGANIIHKQGIPFSLHPIKPDFSKINPAQGFKKIFSRRNATEFSLSLVKMCIWFALSILLVWIFLPSILQAPLCKGNCLLDSSYSIIVVFLVAAIFLLMAAGLLDLPIQFALFRHEQRMGHKELQRELKDTMGNSEFKGHRKRNYQEMLEAAAEEHGPGFILTDGTSMVGLYYDAQEAPVPQMVLKHTGSEAAAAIKEAIQQGIPVIRDESVTRDLYRSINVGAVIKQHQLSKVAMLMVREGLVS